jgi:vacuolar-type H+-ATPase subunit H
MSPHEGDELDEEFERYAQRAGEEFVAAGRAETPEQRNRHRASAERYQEAVHTLLRKRKSRRPEAPGRPE